MKKLTGILFILVIGTVLLTACSGMMAPGQASAGSATDTASTALTASELVAGTLKLQGSDQAVTSTQAKELLTLWEAYKQVNNSDTSSPLEVSALVSQINENMTADQISAIKAMGITANDIQSLADENGASITSTSSSSTTDSTSSSSSSGMGGGPGGGQMPGGDMSGGDMGGSAPVDGGNAGSSSSQAKVSSTNVSTDLVLALVDPLTAMLTTIAA
jgi:hypothetical protein